jgi:hypothetical protein
LRAGVIGALWLPEHAAQLSRRAAAIDTPDPSGRNERDYSACTRDTRAAHQVRGFRGDGRWRLDCTIQD